nr:ribonuclease H-like domain, reverse transcriptase, RNA-dependent DNA polymerase [Tanacetum cinerariifolium]
MQKARLQTLKTEFKMLKMKEDDSIDEFTAKLSSIVTRASGLGLTFDQQTLVRKLLSSVPKRFIQIVAAIEQFTDFEETTLDEEIGRLKAFEERVNLFNGSPSDNQDKLLFSNHDKSSSHEKGFKNGGQEKFRSYQDNKQDGKTKQFNNEKKPSHKFKRNNFQKGTKDSSKVKCYNCNKFGDVRRNCKLKDKGQEQSNLVQEDVEPTLLMAVQEKRDKGKKIFLNEKEIKPKKYISTDESLWYLDNGASNHMTGIRTHFKEVDEKISGRVRFGDGSCVNIKGKGSILLECKNKEQRVIPNVYYIPELKSNILSLRQLTEKGENGILRQLTAPYSPQQNGIVERRNRDIKFKEDEGWDSKSYLDNINPSKPEWRDFIISENQTSSSRIIDEVSTQYLERNDEETSSSRPLDHTPVRGYKNLSEIYNRAPEVQSDELLLLEEKPRNYKEAAQDKKWIKAMQIEIDSINKNKTWKLATLPDNQKAIGLKWVFKTKRDGNWNIINHKARLVAKRYVQEHGIDYDEVFAPVARMETVRIILALSAFHGWEVHHFDVKSTFLHGELKEEVYVTQPEEQAIYIKVRKDSMLLVGVYVDDLIVTGRSKEDLQKFKSQMEERMVDCNETKIPIDPGTKLIKTEGGELVDATEYRSLIGCLRYLLHTRPDLSYSVILLSQFMQEPREQHMKAIRQVLRYIKGTLNFGINYYKNAKCKLLGYSDSSYGINIKGGKGTTGIMFYFGNSPISWSSQKQPTVALSSCESEFMAATIAACQALWLQRLLNALTS